MIVEQSSTKDQSPLLGVLYMEPDQTKQRMWIIHHQTKTNPMKDTIQYKLHTTKRRRQKQKLWKMFYHFVPVPLWYLLVFILSVPFRFTTFDYPFGIYWSLYCLYLLDLRLLITPLYCLYLLDLRLLITPLYCLYRLDLRLLITPLVSFGLCIVCTF